MWSETSHFIRFFAFVRVFSDVIVTGTGDLKGTDGKELLNTKNCTALETVQLGKNVRTIGKYAFAGCSNLKKINHQILRFLHTL